MLKIIAPESDLCMTSALTDVRIYADGEHVDVKVSAEGYELLSGRYYPLGNYVVLPDVGDLARQFLSGDETNVCMLSVEADDGEEAAAASLRVMYCDRDLNVADPVAWTGENFLTPTRFKRLGPGDSIRLRWWCPEKEDSVVTVHATYLDDDGIRGALSYVHAESKTGAGSLMAAEVRQSDIAARIESERGIASPTLQSVTVRCGGRSATFFVDPTLEGGRRFRFLNCFGVEELLVVRGETVAKTKTDRSTATVGRVTSFYDVTNSVEYETETAPLSPDDRVLADQMMTSPKVRVPWGEWCDPDDEFDALAEILVTDFTCEISDDSAGGVKFTWRFATDSPRAELPTSPGIFDYNYGPAFC